MGNELTLSEQAAAPGGELAIAGATASAQHEIQSAIIIAKRMPRNEDVCFQKLMKAADRPSFAEDAKYSFPRGKKEDGTPNYVTGPSVNLAREAARIWGNIRFGLYVVRDDERTRLIRGWAWDVETNTKVEVEDDFEKLIQRKQKGETKWVIPDERDLRELTNRRGAILLRNAILQVLPKDLIEDAMLCCERTLEKKATQDPDATRKRLLVDFSSVNVTVEMLEKKLGHPFSQCSPKELAELRGICKSIQDGHTSWSEYAREPEAQEKASVSDDGLKEAQAQLLEKKKLQGESSGSEGEESSILSFSEAKSMLNIAESAKEIGDVMNRFLAGETTAAQRKEIMSMKDAAVTRLAKHAAGKK